MKSQSLTSDGVERIDEIKKEICNTKSPQVCEAEVYEMWGGIFDPEEQ